MEFHGGEEVAMISEMNETVHVVSDSLGETAGLVVKAVSTQFKEMSSMRIERHSYVGDFQDIDEILQMAAKSPSIVAYTIVVPALKEYMDHRAKELDIVAVDILQPLMNAFSHALNKEPNHQPKLLRQLDEDYFNKIEAVEFAVKYDDGRDPRGVLEADIVLVGISRTSKTPLSMYLAYKGYKVANIPLVPEVPIPKELLSVPRNKCVGLIISPTTLNVIRKERLKHLGLGDQTDYASLQRILDEFDYAENIMKRIGCPIVNVSEKAIEETAEFIIDVLNLRRNA